MIQITASPITTRSEREVALDQAPQRCRADARGAAGDPSDAAVALGATGNLIHASFVVSVGVLIAAFLAAR